MSTQGPKKRANLRDVAKQAGVSVATVSRVLNSPDAVKPRTRALVEQAIEELKFVPSAAARAINSGRTRFVGALIPTLDNAIFARFLAALERVLAERQLSLIVATTNDDPLVEAEKARGLVDIGAEGLIISGVTHDPALSALIERVGLPAIVTSYFDSNDPLPTIGYDNAAVAQTALRHLHDLGHRNIAVLHGPKAGNDRTRARLDGLEQLGLTVELEYFETEISLAGGGMAVDQACDSGRSFSAILCLSDVIALGALFGLQRRGIQVPDNVSLMGIDDLPSSEYAVPALTTVHLPVSRMGEHAARALSDWVESGTTPASHRLEATLVERASTLPYWRTRMK